jgi:hypothetical protein
MLLQAAVLPVVATLRRAAGAEESSSFDAATVRNLARDLAQRAYQAPDATLPDELKNLDYQQYRSIRSIPVMHCGAAKDCASPPSSSIEDSCTRRRSGSSRWPTAVPN